MARELTGKQKAFVIHYLANGFNGTRAAEAAGYKGANATLRVVAHDNLTKPNIAQAVLDGMNRLLMSEEEVAGRLAQIARGEPYAGIDMSGHDVLHALIQMGKRYQMFGERIVIDWRAELREQGIEDADLFERMVQQAFKELGAQEHDQDDD